MNKATLFILILLSFSVFEAISQCEVRGKITDNKGEILIGVTIALQIEPPRGAISDFDGLYSLKLSEPGKYPSSISYISYVTVSDTFTCKKNEVIIKNYILETKISSLNEVVISAKQGHSNDNQLEAMKQKSSSSIDFISSETIKKTGDSNAGAAISRVTGVSSTSGGLITVRGVGDRYLKTTVNGFRIPTLDPFTSNLKLDIFPASLIDNILITKTNRPDLHGDWAGAYVSVETKDYPDTFSVQLETSFGYNAQTTFKNYLSSEKSSTDWLGFDNSFREHDHNLYAQFYNNPSFYQEFAALGLNNYLQSIGVTQHTSWNDTYTKLCLIQLGLLGSSQFNDPDAYQSALQTYNSLDYKGKAFDIINQNAVSHAKTLPDNWLPVTRKAPLSNSQSITIGNQKKLFGKPLGFVAGLRYSSSVMSDTASIANKCIAVNEKENIVTFDSSFQKVSKEIVSWSGLVNLAYKYNPNNSITFMFMPNFTGTNNVRRTVYYTGDDDDDTYAIKISQFYEARQQLIYQLKSSHYLPKHKIKIEFHSSFTNGKSNAPDLKLISLNDPSISKQNNEVNYLATKYGTGRYFRYLQEYISDSRLSAEMPLKSTPELTRKIKIGTGLTQNHRDSRQYYYQLIEGIGSEAIRNANPDAAPYGFDRFEITTTQLAGFNNNQPFRSVQQYYQCFEYPSDHVFGNSTVISAYAMTDYSFTKKIRISGGIRIENANLFTDCFLFDSLKIGKDDPRRQFSAGPGLGEVRVNPGTLQKTNYLPGINMMYLIQPDDKAPMNLRLNFNQTLARPSLRELTDNVVYDHELGAPVRGNSELKIVNINNYDVRCEKFFSTKDNISVSLFYKEFFNHIELLYFGSVGGYIWVNNPERAWLRGIEFEGRKILAKNFEVHANLTLVKSHSKINKTFDTNAGLHFGGPVIEGPMLGQAPYVLNILLLYSSSVKDFSASISYNVQGTRLAVVGAGDLPDIYEIPRHVIDVKINKTINRHFAASIKIQDILNSPIRRNYILNNSYLLAFDQYRYGTNYVFSLSYKL